MQEFFNNLYNIENFTTYLMIAIGVLIVLFIIILLMGKKDQKIEETKRLQREANGTFKETSKPAKVEVKKDEPKKENIDILLPPVVKEETPIKNEEPVFDPVADAKKEEVKEESSAPAPVVTPLEVKEEVTLPEVKLPEVEEVKPVLEEKKEEEIVLPKEDMKDENPTIVLPTFDFDEAKLDTELKSEETTVEAKDESGKKPFAPSEIISLQDKISSNSFEEKEIKEEVKNDFEVINLEEKKETEVTPTVISEEIKLPEFSFENAPEIKEEDAEAFEIELPKLKEETENTEVKPVDFSNISGENYNIRK